MTLELSQLDLYVGYRNSNQVPPCPYCGGESNAIALVCQSCGGHLQIGSWPAIRIALMSDATLAATDSNTRRRLEIAVTLIDVENPLIGQFSPRRRKLANHVDASGFELEEWYSIGLSCFHNGDVEGAEIWFSKAAQSGDARAALNLAVMADEAGHKYIARDWYDKAWQLGLASGARGVACIHLDFNENDSAYKWLQMAVAAGDGPSNGMLDALVSEAHGVAVSHIVGSVAPVEHVEVADSISATDMEVVLHGMRLSSKLGFPKESGRLTVTASQATYEPNRTDQNGRQINRGISAIALDRTPHFEVIVGVIGSRGSFTNSEKYQINVAVLNMDQGLDTMIKIQILPSKMTMTELRVAIETLISSGVPVSINEKPVPAPAIRVSGWGIGFGIGF